MSISISFFSNFFNAHQLPVALELANNPEVDYAFVAMQDAEGIAGRASLNREYSFVIEQYSDDSAASEAMEHAVYDDIVVFGDMAGDEAYVRARAKTGKPFFRYSERLLKRGDWWAYMPPKRWRTYDRFGRYRKSNMYVLCASGYTAGDLAKFGFPTERCLKWGYFPHVDSSPVEARDALLPRDVALSSAQRLIPWKRADLQVRMAKALADKGIGFTLDIAGGGEDEQRLRDFAEDLGVADRIRFLGALSPEETQALMRCSDVFLATSNRKEGWGATLNEAMCAECAVVASNQIGSAPFLIENGVDGVIFRSGDSEDLAKVVATLADDRKRLAGIAAAGRKKAITLWGAECAAGRLVEVSKQILTEGEIVPFEDGPLSEACIISTDWYLG